MANDRVISEFKVIPELQLFQNYRHLSYESLKPLIAMTTAKAKKSFSKFSYAEAFKQLGITKLLPWAIAVSPVSPSAFFQERLSRLQQVFDLRSYEESKKLLIDAVCEEALYAFERLKIWKGAALDSDVLTDNVDYLVAENKAYLEAPFVCIIEAKKDDFEQGLAQCLVEMQACQWQNHQLGQDLTVFGVVTNGQGWQFYYLSTEGKVYETLLYAMSELENILGILHHIFEICQNYLNAQGDG